MDRKNISSKLSLLIDSVIGVTLASVIVFSLYLLPSPTSHYTNIARAESDLSPKQEDAGLPVRLRIPSINVDARIDHVGLTPLGEMDVPEKPELLGWFSQSPRPGENGNTVIAGHSGMKDNVSAAFDNLEELRVGDQIHVEDETGANIAFVVRKIKIYDKSADTSSVFNPSYDGSRLILITCTGVWDKTQRTHSDRLVVFADRLY